MLLAALLAGCATAGPGGDSSPPVTTPMDDVSGGSYDRAIASDVPLLIDRSDLRIGTTVQFGRVPTPAEMVDLKSVSGLAHVVVALDRWPDFTAIQHLGLVPPEADVIVVLRGYPPTRTAAEAWNMVQNARVRIVIVAAGPPPSVEVLTDLNQMRGLERVIAEMDQPSRAGFERLQRPLSFRKVVP